MNTPRVALLAALSGLLAGCTSLFDFIGESATATAPVELPPIVSDRFLLASPDQRVIGDPQVMYTRFEDTFVDIARTYNLGFDELVHANPGVDPWLPGEGTRILLPTRFILPTASRTGIVINLASKRLFYFTEPNEEGVRAVVTFPIGIGREGTATPLGTTTVTSKGRDPVWYPTASIRREYAAEGDPLPPTVPPGPDNPLGKFVLVLGMPSYLIHGTNRPAGVGMRVSHGCIRLFPENIEYLYGIAPVGVDVTIVDEPMQFAWHRGELFFEAHEPLVDDERDWGTLMPERLAAAVSLGDGAREVDPVKLAEVRDATLGLPMAISTRAPSLDYALANFRRVINLVEVPEPEPEMAATEPDELDSP